MYRMISNNVRTKLERLVKGRVLVHLNVNEELKYGFIEVTILQIKSTYRYYSQITYDELNEGLVSDFIVRDVITNYTNYIKSLYFKY